MGELGRKSIHILFGSLFILSSMVFGGFATMLATIACLVGGSTVSYLIQQGLEFPVFSLAVELFEREHEKHLPGKGAIMFFAGAAMMMYFALFVFREEAIITPALVPLVFGDGIATIAGTRWGRHHITGRKSLEGTLAGLFATIIGLSFFLWPLYGKIITVSMVAMLVELLPVNDNLTIPLASSIVLYIML